MICRIEVYISYELLNVLIVYMQKPDVGCYWDGNIVLENTIQINLVFRLKNEFLLNLMYYSKGLKTLN